MKSDQRVALITGAARGIGLATARKFLAENHRVALLDIDAETLSRAMKLMDPDQTLGLECDVAEPNQVNDSVDRLVSEYGRIDVLVNNAGIATFSPILETSFEEWSRILAVNLNGPFICTQACAPVMLENGGGSIVNIASISGFRASTLRVAYGTSKAGVMQLTKQQAAELGNMGIRVNAVAPGPVETELFNTNNPPGSESRVRYIEGIPMKRVGLPEELAAANCYFLVGQSGFTTGQTLFVDGGYMTGKSAL